MGECMDRVFTPVLLLHMSLVACPAASKGFAYYFLLNNYILIAEAVEVIASARKGS